MAIAKERIVLNLKVFNLCDLLYTFCTPWWLAPFRHTKLEFWPEKTVDLDRFGKLTCANRELQNLEAVTWPVATLTSVVARLLNRGICNLPSHVRKFEGGLEYLHQQSFFSFESTRSTKLSIAISFY